MSKVISINKNTLEISHTERKGKKAEPEFENICQDSDELADYRETVREDERGRIARDLHDEVGGSLAALIIDISWLKKNCHKDKVLTEVKLAGMAEYTQETLLSLKRIINNLRPETIDNLGFPGAIEWMLNDFLGKRGISCQLDINITNKDIDESISVPLYRMVQEALNNIIKHANSNQVQFGANIIDKEIVIKIKDNGVGFKPDTRGEKNRFGLAGIRERLVNMNGKLIINSEPEIGTELVIKVPVVEKG